MGPGPGEFLGLRETATLFPALLCILASATAMLTRERDRPILWGAAVIVNRHHME